jgi:hypothetical protein
MGSQEKRGAWTNEVPARPSSAASWRWAVFASVVLFCLAVAGVIYWRTDSEVAPAQVAQSAPVAVTLDVSQAGTTRGSDTSTVPVGVLPRRVVTAHVILPNFSSGGDYVVSVTTDRSSTSEKPTGRAVARVQRFHGPGFGRESRQMLETYFYRISAERFRKSENGFKGSLSGQS